MEKTKKYFAIYIVVTYLEAVKDAALDKLGYFLLPSELFTDTIL